MLMMALSLHFSAVVFDPSSLLHYIILSPSLSPVLNDHFWSFFLLYPSGVSLQGLVDFIKTQVPEEQWHNTPIWLKATAGLRLVEKSQSDAVLDSVRQFLGDSKNSPFMFKNSWARMWVMEDNNFFSFHVFQFFRFAALNFYQIILQSSQFYDIWSCSSEFPLTAASTHFSVRSCIKNVLFRF